MKDFRITNTNHPNLDGLRAVGILMVLVSHFFSPLFNVTVLWTSIDLLFALSGLLITGILIETKDDPQYFKKFYMRRLLRIFPLYYLLLLLFSLYAFVISIHPENFIYFKNNFGYFLTYTQNWYFIRSGMPLFGHLNHTWTLAIDEQIYLLWPLLLWLCKNNKQLVLLCAATLVFSLTYRVVYNYSHPVGNDAYFINTFCRIDSFAAGSLMYCVLRFSPAMSERKVFLTLLASLALFLACGFADGSFLRSGNYMRNFGCTLAGIHFSTWLYFAVTARNSILKFILSNRLIVYIGKISYSLYVFHWFILIIMGARINDLLLHAGIHSLLLSSVSCLALVFIVSMLSYHFFEKPIIKLKKKFSYAKIPVNAGHQ